MCSAQVEIANYELFSSSPKDFRVFISDRYPTRDWALLGQFTAADERSIQSFIVEQQFGKFVKVYIKDSMDHRFENLWLGNKFSEMFALLSFLG